jgi:methyl-accepting chemotaxis protein
MTLQGQVVQLASDGRIEAAAALVNGEINQIADQMTASLNELIALNTHHAGLATTRPSRSTVQRGSGSWGCWWWP